MTLLVMHTMHGGTIGHINLVPSQFLFHTLVTYSTAMHCMYGIRLILQCMISVRNICRSTWSSNDTVDGRNPAPLKK